jgi:hypothetical protein
VFVGSDEVRERGRGRGGWGQEELLRCVLDLRRRGRARREAHDEVGVALGRCRRCRIALVAAVVLCRGSRVEVGEESQDAKQPNIVWASA